MNMADEIKVSGQYKWNTASMGSVKFKTNGPQGGDAGHGGYLEVELFTNSSTELEVSVDGGPPRIVRDKIVLKFRGDAEIDAARECFDFLSKNKNKLSGQHDWNTACMGSLRYETNGPQGGDAGHGGYLKVEWSTYASTELEVSIDGGPFRRVNEIVLNFRGDAEIDAARQCFEFLSKALEVLPR
jgi:hypothetical protein